MAEITRRTLLKAGGATLAVAGAGVIAFPKASRCPAAASRLVEAQPGVADRVLAR